MTAMSPLSHPLSSSQRSLLGSPDQREIYIACTSEDQATGTETFLSVHLGTNNIHPVFVSQASNTVCFSTFATSDEAMTIQGLTSIK